MGQWWEWLERCNEPIHRFIWGPVMLLLLVGTGLWFTLRSGFFQIRGWKLWWRKTLIDSLRQNRKKKKEKGEITPFQAMCTAMAGTVGTGNIAGVATAITMGGPGAVFWMGLSALLGTMTCFAENVLGSLYRWRDDQGRWHGGAMAYLERGAHCPMLARLYAVFCICSTLGMGNMVQANSIASVAWEQWHIVPAASGYLMAALAALVILGGIGAISRVTEKLVPTMAMIYLGGALCVVLAHASQLPAVLRMVLQEAFSLRAGMGGLAGYSVASAIRLGVSRGVFSNEAGLGMSVLAHVESSEREPVVQGMWGIFQVVADTLVVCGITALAVLTGSGYDPQQYAAVLGSPAFDALPNGAQLTTQAFSSVFGPFGGVIVGLSLMMFAFSTVLASSYYGSMAVEYLAGKKAVLAYKILFICTLIVGSVMQLRLVWQLSDTFNGLMALPNLFGVLVLSPQVFRSLKDYLKRQKQENSISKTEK